MSEKNTPAVHLNLDQVEYNIKTMVQNLAKYNIIHRPHIKVHKSVYLANLQEQLGCQGVTVATLGEAEAMANGGIRDILIAFPIIGEEKLEHYSRLLRRSITLRSVINSLKGAKDLSALGERMKQRIPVLIEIDGGIQRGGVSHGQPLIDFALHVKDLPGLEIQGILYYGGDVYGLSDENEIRKRSAQERQEILDAVHFLQKLGLDMQIISGGSSFSARYPEELRGLTEVRAGNYIFNDCAQLSIGLIPEEMCAMTILATVVSRPSKNSAIIDAGSKALSSDLVLKREGYGLVKGHPEIIIHKLNEEHGFLRSSQEIPFEVGDTLSIIPNHACVISNLAGKIYAMRNDQLERILPIEAQGKTQ